MLSPVRAGKSFDALQALDGDGEVDYQVIQMTGKRRFSYYVHSNPVLNRYKRKQQKEALRQSENVTGEK